jgi:hypothetical protein
VAITKAGTVYLLDGNGRIRHISGGTITAIAGAGFGFNGNELWALLTIF